MDPSSAVSTRVRHRVAILVDGDNFPRAEIARVESEAQRRGDVTIRRVFGDMTLHKDWAQDISYTATHSPTSAGKNRADIMLVVAAMDLAHRGLATTFFIVSDDRDFAPLVNHLREQGYGVVWPGKTKRESTEKARPKPAGSNARADQMVDKVMKIIEGAGSVGFPIQSLGPAGQKAGIKISETPQKTWRAWLLAHPDLFSCDPKGPEARVRLLPQRATP